MIPSQDTLKSPVHFIHVQVPMVLTVAETQMIMRFRMMKEEALAIVEIGADGFPKAWDIRLRKREMPSQ